MWRCGGELKASGENSKYYYLNSDRSSSNGKIYPLELDFLLVLKMTSLLKLVIAIPLYILLESAIEDVLLHIPPKKLIYPQHLVNPLFYITRAAKLMCASGMLHILYRAV